MFELLEPATLPTIRSIHHKVKVYAISVLSVHISTYLRCDTDFLSAFRCRHMKHGCGQNNEIDVQGLYDLTNRTRPANVSRGIQRYAYTACTSKKQHPSSFILVLARVQYAMHTKRSTSNEDIKNYDSAFPPTCSRRVT